MGYSVEKLYHLFSLESFMPLQSDQVIFNTDEPGRCNFRIRRVGSGRK
jgi:hypothetical protein